MTQQNTAVFPPIMVKPQVHVGVLDLMRGFAALCVVLFHFTGDSHADGALAKFYSPFMRNTFSWSYLGVDIFFVISGLLFLTVFGILVIQSRILGNIRLREL